MTRVRQQVSARCKLGRRGRQRDLGDHFLDDGAAERVEVLGYQDERARAADDSGLIIFLEPAGRVGVLGIPGHRAVAQDDETVDDDALGDGLVAASFTSRPALFVPSPDTSMVRRAAWNGARSNWAAANSMPPLIEVRSANERGNSRSWSPNLRAGAGPSLMVQSITSFCAPKPDHSTKQTAIR